MHAHAIKIIFMCYDAIIALRRRVLANVNITQYFPVRVSCRTNFRLRPKIVRKIKLNSERGKNLPGNCGSLAAAAIRRHRKEVTRSAPVIEVTAGARRK